MGTRGLMIIRIEGVDKMAYNHFDNIPEGWAECLEKAVYDE